MGFSAASRYRQVAKRLLEVPSRMSAASALAVEKLWRRSYMAGTDPYGKPWAPNKPSTIRRKGHNWVMVDKQETLDATRVRPLPGAGISLRTGPKAAWHLEPSGTRPARPVLPLSGLPATWLVALKKIAADAAQKAVHGG